MEISSKLPQFTQKSALIVVASKQEAVFYWASKGVLERARSFLIEKPRYSDREGFFVRTGLGRFFGAGSSYEGVKKKVLQDFHKEYEESIKELSKRYNPDLVYFFASPYVVNDVQEELPPQWRGKIKDVFQGNYVKRHPFDLLKRIAER